MGARMEPACVHMRARSSPPQQPDPVRAVTNLCPLESWSQAAFAGVLAVRNGVAHSCKHAVANQKSGALQAEVTPRPAFHVVHFWGVNFGHEVQLSLCMEHQSGRTWAVGTPATIISCRILLTLLAYLVEEGAPWA